MSSKKYDARSKELNALVAKLYAKGLDNRGIAARSKLSVTSVVNRLRSIGLPSRPAPRDRIGERERRRQKAANRIVVAPIKPIVKPVIVAVKVQPLRPMTAAERVAMEARRKALIFAMGSSPTPEQCQELSSIVASLDGDAFARSTMRAAA